ncbi:fatty acyl-CoA reductase 1-like [Rhynchophorus ferrugineus]|uniref:fatty acyl-CoA reductase 1-like n=1 Tax=Rhynchophorus ferrugineus TaxID=354439 RepID=UPI003FCC9F24
MVTQEFPSGSSSATNVVSMAAFSSNVTANSAVQSSVADFYNGKTVFITGGTGFMGKVLLEKLLRSCSGVSKIYLLIRPKRGQNPQERLEQIMASPVRNSTYYFFH